MTLLIITDGKISDSASTVPITTVVTVTASRALNTTYTNTTGRTMYVKVSVKTTRTGAGSLYVRGVSDSIVQDLAGSTVGAVDETHYMNVGYTVVPGKTYGSSMVTTGGTITLETWTESY